MTQLGQKLAAAKGAPLGSPETPLARWRKTNQRGQHVTLPILGRVWIELAGESVVTGIESEVFKEMEAKDLPAIPLNMPTFDSTRTRLTLAWAVRTAERHDERFGTAEEWGELDLDLVNSCGVFYATVREELDPMGLSTLTAESAEGIRLAIEKKNPTLLRSFGIANLSLYLLATAAQASSSPTPTFGSGESSPET